MPETALAQLRIARLAGCLPTHRAFHWLHLHEPQLRRWQLEMLGIPAPPFGEDARAAWFLERFRALGLSNVHLDEAGNALGELIPATPVAGQAFILLSAHLDTVFAAGIDTAPAEDGTRILGPGACDNAAGLTGLLAMIAALRFAAIAPPLPILFAANVGEEGEGDLRGMRHLFETGSYRQRIVAALALEGSGTAAAVTSGLGSVRLRVTITGPGGHSWTDADAPNPITLLGRGLVAAADHFAAARARDGATQAGAIQAGTPRATFSPGQISGGTSINSIPASAMALLDLRSSERTQLDAMVEALQDIFERVVSEANRQRSGYAPAQVRIETIGSRPAASLPHDSPLLHTLRAVDRHLGIRTELRLGSTDANLPLSIGVPAAALAAGGTGGGIHTLGEWYDPTGREMALRRILLTLLDLAQTFVPV